MLKKQIIVCSSYTTINKINMDAHNYQRTLISYLLHLDILRTIVIFVFVCNKHIWTAKTIKRLNIHTAVMLGPFCSKLIRYAISRIKQTVYIPTSVPIKPRPFVLYVSRRFNLFSHIVHYVSFFYWRYEADILEMREEIGLLKDQSRATAVMCGKSKNQVRCTFKVVNWFSAWSAVWTFFQASVRRWWEMRRKDKNADSLAGRLEHKYLLCTEKNHF